jgi:hypothetical protein
MSESPEFLARQAWRLKRQAPSPEAPALPGIILRAGPLFCDPSGRWRQPVLGAIHAEAPGWPAALVVLATAVDEARVFSHVPQFAAGNPVDAIDGASLGGWFNLDLLADFPVDQMGPACHVFAQCGSLCSDVLRIELPPRAALTG